MFLCFIVVQNLFENSYEFDTRMIRHNLHENNKRLLEMELKILRTNLSQRYDFKETKEMIKFQKVTPVKTQAYF